MSYGESEDTGAMYSRYIREGLDGMPMTSVIEATKVAWEFHHRMRTHVPSGQWEVMDIDLPKYSEVNQELVEKINLVCASAPSWGKVTVEWPPNRCLVTEDDKPKYFAEKAAFCSPDPFTSRFTLEGILGKYWG